MCFWLIRLLAGDSRTLLEWPEFRAALAASPVALRRARGANLNAATLRNWTQSLTTRAKVEVKRICCSLPVLCLACYVTTPEQVLPMPSKELLLWTLHYYLQMLATSISQQV
jgi:hypothetical protein